MEIRDENITKIIYRTISHLALLYISISISNVNAIETTFNADITVDSSYIKNGLYSTNNNRGLINIGFETDLAKIIDKQSYLSVGYAMQRGDNGSDIAGDIQGFSNIDAEDFNHAFEIIFGMELSNISSFKLGQMDANSDFATTEYGGEFINSSMGFSPTIQGLPTYPQPTLGIYAEYRMNPVLTTRFGYYESSAKYSHFDDYFSIAEAQWHYQSNSSIKLGIWNHSGLKTSNKKSESSSHIYIVVDHYFSDQFSAFIQWGQAEESLVEIAQHISFGVNYQGVFTEDDTLGLGITQVDVVGADSEQVIELFYLYPINDTMNIKSDFQYISSPSGDRSMDNIQIFTLRLTARF